VGSRFRFLCKIATVISGIFLFGSDGAFATDLSWNGFGSIYAIQPVTSNRLASLADHLDFNRGTQFGLNLRGEMNTQWSLVAQITASTNDPPHLGSTADWKLKADWVYLVYNPTEAFTLRAGRQLFPLYMASEYLNTAFAYPWREPPYQVYGLAPFKAFSGLSAEYKFNLDSGLFLTTGIFGGNENSTSTYGLGLAEITLNLKNLVGAAVTLDGDGWRARAAFDREDVNIDYNYGTVAINGSTGTPVHLRSKVTNSNGVSVGGRYDKNSLVLAGEYTRRWCLTGDRDPTTGIRNVEGSWGFYTLAGYRLGRWLPRYTYGFADFRLGSVGSNGKFYTHNLGLNYQVAPTIVAKTEYQWDENPEGYLRVMRTGEAQTWTAGLDFIF
jgi:hypothetical protein